MTPEQKAKELFDKYRNELSWLEKDYKVDLYRDARQCALITVDELILHSSILKNYWIKVKEEINLL